MVVVVEKIRVKVVKFVIIECYIDYIFVMKVGVNVIYECCSWNVG